MLGGRSFSRVVVVGPTYTPSLLHPPRSGTFDRTKIGSSDPIQVKTAGFGDVGKGDSNGQGVP